MELITAMIENDSAGVNFRRVFKRAKKAVESSINKKLKKLAVLKFRPRVSLGLVFRM